VLVIRGRANSNYRASFNRIYSVGSNGGWVQGSKLNPLESLTPPLTKRLGFAKQKYPEQVRRETHELFHSSLELIDELALIKMLEQPATEKQGEGG
jgi:hypothetical protein